MFTRIGSLLKSVPTRSRAPGPILALQIRQAAKEVLDKVLSDYPEDLAKKVKVKTFKNGVLTVTSPQLMSAELQMRSEGLKRDINKIIRGDLVKRIVFRTVH